MSAPVDPARKLCPTCGHSNRFEAKICAQCGTPFRLVRSEGETRKRCTECGHYNRMSAKVCANCGHGFTTIKIAARSRTPKWCPQCGTPRRPNAKVCSRCGHRFVKVAPEVPPAPRITQSEVLAQPVDRRGTAAVSRGRPRPNTDVSGEPAPYISPEELKRLSESGRTQSTFDTVMTFFRTLFARK